MTATIKENPECSGLVTSPYLKSLIDERQVWLPRYDSVLQRAHWHYYPILRAENDPLDLSLPCILDKYDKAYMFVPELWKKLISIKYAEFIMVYAEGPENTYEILKKNATCVEEGDEHNLRAYLRRVYSEIVEMIMDHAPRLARRLGRYAPLESIKERLDSWMPSAEIWEPYVSMAENCILASKDKSRVLNIKVTPEVEFFKTLLLEGYSVFEVIEAFEDRKEVGRVSLPSSDWGDADWHHNLSIVRYCIESNRYLDDRATRSHKSKGSCEYSSSLHVKNKDMVMMKRRPKLHKASMKGQKVRVFPGSRPTKALQVGSNSIQKKKTSSFSKTSTRKSRAKSFISKNLKKQNVPHAKRA